MSSTIIALVILAGCCGGLLLTMRLRHRLPPHHQEDATRDLIKIATGMLATLVALILGLLVSSAKTPSIRRRRKSRRAARRSSRSIERW